MSGFQERPNLPSPIPSKEPKGDGLGCNIKYLKYSVFLLFFIPDPTALMRIASVSVIFAVTVYLEKALLD